ncbi:MAG: nucleoside monophosphate kinase [Candidatus Niyogibacteria bacterium]|nr:MAG: nucleoside monophosphate kinase [Candidatus Niyogibacteria bacterium]
MKSRIVVAVFMGLSGSGKDTQVVLLKEFLEKKHGLGSVLYVYTGEVLRNMIKRGLYLSKLTDEKVMRVGAKAPDFLAIWSWTHEIIEHFTGKEHLLFSSSPRTEIEARVMDDLVDFLGISPYYPIFLKVERDEAFRRLKERGRADDTDEVINNRLDFFEVHVGPAVEYYRTKSLNRLIEIDGNSRDPQKIHQNILKALGFENK